MNNNNDIQKQLAKLRRNKKLLWLGVLFLVLIILWILVSIFATTKTSTISQELRDLSKAFVPRLESKVFDEILTKRAFSEEELASFSIFIVDKNNVDSDEVIIDIMAPSQEMEETSEEELVEPDSAITSISTGSSSIQEENTSTTSSTTPGSVTVSPTDSQSTTTPFIEFMKANY